MTANESSYQGRAAFTDYIGKGFEYVFYKDDPNTSVGIARIMADDKETSRTLLVNGKSDSNTNGDLSTTLMLAHLPLLLAQKIESVAVIGFGTGVTVGAVVSYPEVQKVDVIEISRSVIEQAPLFDAYTKNVSRDPRVHLIENDAFKFFKKNPLRYDVVISEPSNPYVNGVENLFTDEFYRLAKSQLGPEGVFVQWMHTYYLSAEIFTKILRTINGQFPKVRIFQLRQGDVAIIASLGPVSAKQLKKASLRMQISSVKDSLHSVEVSRIETVLATEVMPPSLTSLFTNTSGAALRLEQTTLNFEAAKTKFMRTNANVFELSSELLPRFYKNDFLLSQWLQGKDLTLEAWQEFKRVFCERENTRHPNLCEATFVLGALLSPNEPWDDSLQKVFAKLELSKLAPFIENRKRTFSRKEKTAVDEGLNWIRQHQGAIVQIPLSRVLPLYDACLASVPKTDSLYGECLFHRLFVQDARGVPKVELMNDAGHYLEWFKTLKPAAVNYSTFVAAKVRVEIWIQ